MVSNSVSNALILSFLFFLSIESVLSQTLDEEIAKLPTCSTNCLSKAAANIKCGAVDFICQCGNQDGIVGALGRVTTQAACLLGDCGIQNATTTRVVFKKICSILNLGSSTTASVAPAVSIVQTSSPDQVLASSTSDTLLISTSLALGSTISPTLSLSSIVSTLTTQISIPTSTTAPTTIVSSSSTAPTTIVSSSSTPLSPPTSLSTISFTQSTAAQSPIAASTSTSTSKSTSTSASASASSSVESSTTSQASYTSSIAGAAKMSPIAESNSYNPTQAGESSPITVNKTQGKLSKGTVIAITIGAVLVAVAIIGTAFWFWQKKKMQSASRRKFAAMDEQAGSGSRAGGEEKAQTYEVREKEVEREEKSLPPHPESPRTLKHDESSSAVRASIVNLDLESSPAPKESLGRSSRLQPTTYNPSASSNRHPEQGSSNGKSNPQRSTVSSFIPSNTAHKSAASSFFANIPILLDSKEGCCEDCLENREKYRSIFRSSSKSSARSCSCPKKDHASPHATPEPDRGVSGLSITRSEVEEELLVGRVPTLISERTISGISRESEWMDELALEKELSKISEESDVKPLRSNPVTLPPRPLFTRKLSSKDNFDFGFRGRS